MEPLQPLEKLPFSGRVTLRGRKKLDAATTIGRNPFCDVRVIERDTEQAQRPGPELRRLQVRRAAVQLSTKPRGSGRLGRLETLSVNAILRS